MKKFLAIILSLAMVLGMATMVAAAEPIKSVTEPGNSQSGDVTINVTPGTGDEVYEIEIDWTALIFTYSFGTEAKWDPSTHTYSDGTEAGWVLDGGAVAASAVENITVKNHTNAVVYATASLTDTASMNGVVVTVDTVEKTLENAATESYGARENAPMETIAVTVTGIPEVTSTFTIPAIKVTISDTPAANP